MPTRSAAEAPSITESPTARIGPLRGIGAPRGGGAWFVDRSACGAAPARGRCASGWPGGREHELACSRAVSLRVPRGRSPAAAPRSPCGVTAHEGQQHCDGGDGERKRRPRLSQRTRYAQAHAAQRPGANRKLDVAV